MLVLYLEVTRSLIERGYLAIPERVDMKGADGSLEDIVLTKQGKETE